MKKVFMLMMLCIALFSTSCGSDNNTANEEKVLYVYSWGDYLDPDTLKIFENETGIHVILDEFDTVENMYPRVAEGAVQYDVLCPADYMIEKLISENKLQQLDFNKLPEATKNIGKDFIEKTESFEPGDKYSVPYCWGTVGIIYDKTKVSEPVDSWSILWNEKYAGQILLLDSVRDSLMIPLKLMGKSSNETDKEILKQAQDMLTAQKKLVQGYFGDEVKDKMINSEAALAVVYNGDATKIVEANPNMEFVIPKEGTNFWIDSWVILKNAPHSENAHTFINFMCRPDIALKNFDYLGYSTPNSAVRDLVQNETLKNSSIAFPKAEVYANEEMYKALTGDIHSYFNNLWKQTKLAQ